MKEVRAVRYFGASEETVVQIRWPSGSRTEPVKFEEY